MKKAEDPRFRLAYEIEVASITQQEATVDELHNRTNVFLGTAFIAETLLIGLGDPRKPPIWLAVLIGIVLIVSIGLLLDVLIAKRIFTFSFDGKLLLTNIHESKSDNSEISIDTLLRKQTEEMEKAYRENSGLIKSMQWRFNLGLLLVSLQLLALAVSDLIARYH